MSWPKGYVYRGKPKTCPVCKVEFVPVATRQKICGKGCRSGFFRLEWWTGKHYGLERDWYDTQLKKQEGRCAICKTDRPNNTQKTGNHSRFKREFLSGVHLPSHVYKLALIKSGHTGTYGASTTAYGQVSGDEVPNGLGYTTGGATLAGMAFALASSTASIDWNDVAFASATISADGAVIYNASVAGSGVVGVYSFGGTVSSTSGTFSVTIPSAGTGVVRIA